MAIGGNSELEVKAKRLNELFDRYRVDGVMFTERANFAWVSGGKNNMVANSSPVGVASILATKTERICVTNTIEGPRMLGEELQGMGWKVVEVPWENRAAQQKIVKDLVGAKRIVADLDVWAVGMAALPPAMAELRYTLTEGELTRYREGGRRTTNAVQSAAREVKPGISEFEVAGILEHHLRRQSLNPVVTLVACDERIERFRHPVPTDKKLARYVMMVTCAEYRGLIVSMTRFVHFGKLPEDLRRKHAAVCNVDAAAILSSKAGKMLHEIFGVIEKAYEEQGFAGQAKLHHQGGVTGYQPREYLASPENTTALKDMQALAWNPSVPGMKSEDTIVISPRGHEFITQVQGDWPKAMGMYKGVPVHRADVLCA